MNYIIHIWGNGAPESQSDSGNYATYFFNSVTLPTQTIVNFTDMKSDVGTASVIRVKHHIKAGKAMDNKIRILHVEDSKLDSLLIMTYLANGDFPFDYFLADTKEDFQKTLENENIDIILSDYSLPGFDGNQALRIARENYPGIPFIFVSGVMGEHTAIDALRNGAMDYVLKSNPERLVPAIRRATHENQLKKELVIANAKLIYQCAEKGKWEAELVVANEKAKESDRLKSAFLANMSHEIRTPMNGILGFAVLLKEPGLTGEKQQEYIRTLETSGERMLNTINNIVEISKIQSGQARAVLSHLDINRKVAEICKIFRPEAKVKETHLSIGKRLSPDDAMIKTDPEMLSSILSHLIKNAIKYTAKGTIELVYEKKGDNICFCVKDTGIGIPPDRQQVIFERFGEADVSNYPAFQGAGLGLSISKAYIEMLGGKLWVESEAGKGSEFCFTLPFRNKKQKI